MSNKNKINPTNELGKKYGRLTVISYYGQGKVSDHKWNCICDCGTKRFAILQASLRRGHSKSCGCLQKEKAKSRITKSNTTHGSANRTKVSPEYKSWDSMIQRCTNINHKSYSRYGGRGITICGRWLHSFEEFFKDVGKRPHRSFSLERKDNSRGYEPDNVKWATASEQANNTSKTIKITFNNQTLTLAQWARKINITPACIYYRYKKNWPLEKLLKEYLNE